MRFEPLEVRALLSVSPGGGLDELGPDPAASVLAAPSMSGQSTSWIDTLTAEQAQVRDELHALLSRGGTIVELENFQPVLMPEAFLDELYDTYRVQQTWNSLRWQMDALFGSAVLMYRNDTPGFVDVFQDFEVIDHPDSVPWVDTLTPQQAQVRDELHALLSRGGTISELENFQPVLMPEAFLDELYDTYGVQNTWNSLRWQMDALFGTDVLMYRDDTPGHFAVFQDHEIEDVSGISSLSLESLSFEQIQLREELHALVFAGGKIEEMEDFQAVLMPEAFLDELYNTYGVTRTWDSLGSRMDDVFGSDVLLHRDDTPGFFGPTQFFYLAPWMESLTPEQAQLRGDLHALLSRGGKIEELEDFQPVLMPEAFLDELYDTYGVTQTWESLRSELDGLFGDDVFLNRSDTPAYPGPSQSSDTSWRDSLTPEQAHVRDEVLSVVSRGGKIEELEDFEPVLMPEAFLDELYDAYGVMQTWESLRSELDGLFGDDIFLNRDDTPAYPDPSQPSDTLWRDSLTPEQAHVRDEVLSVVSRGGKIDELEDFQPVRMPEAFLDELYDTYGVTQTWESLRSELDGLFGDDVFLNRSDTPAYPNLVQSVDLIGGFDLHLDYPALGGGAGYAIAVLDSGFDVDHPVFGWDNDSDGVADRIVYQEDFGDPSDAADRADTSDYTSNHGTIVASVAAGVEWRQSPLPDASRTGVARGADLVLLKITRDDGSSDSGIIQAALQWVTQHVTEYNIVAVNLSYHWGIGRYDDACAVSGVTSDEFEQLAEQGVICITAAGNDHGPSLADVGIVYPAADPYTISVGAVYDAPIDGGDQTQSYGTLTNGTVYAYSTEADRIAPYSQRGAVLDVMAPGSLIGATAPNGTLAQSDGTSVAAPHVAGSVAVLQKLAMEEIGRRLSFGEVRALMQSTGVSVIDSATAGGVGGNENDNVYHTGDTYQRLDASAMGDLIAAFSPPVYTAGAYANNGVADTFELTRSGSYLVLTVKEGDVTRSTAYLSATGGGEFIIRGSNDGDSFVVYNLGNFTGVVNIQGVETPSATDGVQIYDTPGDDVWDAREGYGSFQMENAYRVTASNVYALHGYANAGGNDRAYLAGNATGNKVKTYENGDNLVRIYQNGVWSRAKFFDSVNIYGNGGNDEAIVNDTPGNDAFKATKDDGQHIAAGGTLEYNYFSFETVTAYAGAGIRDTAHFSDSALREEVRARPDKVEVRDIDADTVYLTMRGFDYVHSEALTDDGKSDIMKMQDDLVATIDLLFAEEFGGRVHAEYYYNPANYYSPQAGEMIYESLGFEITKGYSAYGPDKKDTDGVNPALLAWEGSWDEI